MALGPGDRLGPYEIQAAIGAGGMGEVYRARDTRLKRDVALKVLLDSFASDPDRLARFQREAEVLASLSHPNIAAIHGLEENDGVRALVMELVDGETLADRIARGPIAIDEALPIAKQIAEALEAAHEQGIIHRDLKPANIKVRSDGTVKVLDFGLAKLNDPNVPNASNVANALSLSPTITSPALMTGVGILLGTAAYMAPEQARGKPADKRSDIWAFGCVLYEMLTGKRAYAGDDVAEVMASVLAREPDWSALPMTLAPAFVTLIQSCLTKDRRQRVADASTVVYVLATSATPSVAAVTVSRAPRGAALWRRVAAQSAVALLMLAVGGGIVWFAIRPSAPRVLRLTITSGSAAALTINTNDRDIAITPDGSRVVYVGNRGTQLFVRALDALEPVAVYTGTPRAPFVSPDGQWIGFIDTTNTLRKVAMTGGPAVTLARLDGGSRGATWGPDDTIIFATSATTGLQRVTAGGGPTTVLTRPDRVHGESDHLWPEMLPDGHSVLFTIAAVSGGLDVAQVAVLDLQTGTRKAVVRGGSDAHYVPSGHLVYAAAGTLRAVPFDLARLETRGTPAPVIPAVITTPQGGVDAVFAGDGTMAYVSGGGALGLRTLVWVDRQGREMPLAAPPHAYAYLRLSPDGTRVAAWASDEESDIWIWDLARTTLTRATFDPSVDLYPLWTPDGRRLIFSSERGGTRNLYWQSADGTGAVERLTDSPDPQNPTGASPDGRRLIFAEINPKTGEDVMQMELDGAHRITPLVQSPFAERNGVVSPDGHWLAYQANDSGHIEIYVRPYPDVNSGHWQVSTSGGEQPLWARSGEELFYVAPTSALMRVGVEPSTTWAATTPTRVIKEGYYMNPSGAVGRYYDVSPDGQRFLMIKEGGDRDQTAAPPQIIVVQHFDEELKRLVATK